MNEKKRFTIDKIFKEYPKLRDNETECFYHLVDNERNAEIFCERLNNLVEENEQLEKGKMEALSLLGEEIDKNEQLKKDDLLFFQQVFGILMKYQHLFNREMADEVLGELGIELTEWFE